jgi:hypothetical protein
MAYRSMAPRLLACCWLAAGAALVGCTSSASTASAPSAAPSSTSSAASSTAATAPSSAAPGSVAPATTRVTVTPAGAAVQLATGASLQIVLPASGGGGAQTTTYGVTPPGTAILAPVVGTPGLFTAVGDGVTKIEVTQAPVCAAGQVCVAHILLVGSVTVTVHS